MSLIKRLLLLVLALCCVLAIVATVFVKNLDLNRHKDRIQQLVLDKTGRQLQINGEISASVFPWIGLSLNDVSLANSADFPGVDFARVSSSDVQVKLLPLLAGNINVQSVQLHGLELDLQKDADGHTNWEDLMATTAVVETDNGSDDVTQEVEAGAPVVAALSVESLSITDATVRWTDKQNNSDLLLQGFELTTEAIALSRPFVFTTGFNVSSETAAIGADVQASGEININLAENRYTLSGLKLSTIANGAALPVPNLPLKLGADLNADLNAQSLDVDKLDGLLAGVPLEGDVHVTNMLEAPNVFGRIGTGAFNVADVFNTLQLPLPETLDVALFSDSNASTGFQLADDQLLLRDLRIGTGGVQLNGEFQINNLALSPVVDGTLSSDTPFDLSSWAAAFGLTPTDPAVLKNTVFKTSVRQSGHRLALNEFALQLDDFTLQGHFEIEDMRAAIPPIRFEATGGDLLLDRYLPAAVESADTTNTGVSENTTQEPAALPIELIKALDIAGQIELGSLTVAGVTLSDVTVPVVAIDGRLAFENVRASLYEGTLFSALSLDTSAEEPRLTLSSKLNGVQAEPLLAGYLQSEAPLSGTAIASVDLLSRGRTLDELYARINGAISTRFTDGALNGINIGREVRRARAVFAGQQFSAVEDELKTDFSELSVSALLENGLLQSDDLDFKSPLLRLSGAGVVNLPDQSVDYLLQALVTATSEGQGGAELAELNGLKLPVPIRGAFSELGVDFTNLLVNGLKSDFANQFNARKEALINEQKAAAAARLKAEEEALQQRLQQEREAAEKKLQEQRQAVIEQTEKKKAELQQKLDQEKAELKRKLEQNLKKGLGNLLGD